MNNEAPDLEQHKEQLRDVLLDQSPFDSNRRVVDEQFEEIYKIFANQHQNLISAMNEYDELWQYALELWQQENPSGTLGPTLETQAQEHQGERRVEGGGGDEQPSSETKRESSSTDEASKIEALEQQVSRLNNIVERLIQNPEQVFQAVQQAQSSDQGQELGVEGNEFTSSADQDQSNQGAQAVAGLLGKVNPETIKSFHALVRDLGQFMMAAKAPDQSQQGQQPDIAELMDQQFNSQFKNMEYLTSMFGKMQNQMLKMAKTFNVQSQGVDEESVEPVVREAASKVLKDELPGVLREVLKEHQGSSNQGEGGKK